MPIIERSDEPFVRILTLNRPKARNALNLAMWEKLRDELSAATSDRVRCLVITGAGTAFCSGGDIVETGGDDYLERIYTLTCAVVGALYELPCPTIAMINGAVVGAGLELALACDFRCAGNNAKFRVGFTSFAAPPEAISGVMLPRLLGIERAKRFVFTNALWNAEQAYEYGLVSEVFADDQLHVQTVNLASELGKGPTGALAMGKELMNKSFERSVQQTLSSAHELGVASQLSADAAEGVQAMVEKRQPVFTGQ